MRPIPHSIPGYQLCEYLGGGPTCVVYSAVRESNGRNCVVKALRAVCSDHARAVQLLQREARAGQAIRHPHLVRVLAARVSEAPYYLVMELLPGETLRQRLRRHYALDVPAALSYARQTAEALDALHRAGYIHGDVKPDNVRLTDAGTVKLIDLGFAHRPGEDASLLEEGIVLGTANYVAPELCRSNAVDVFAGDVFSLGVMLFELLTGELPYPSGSTQETMTRHRDDAPALLRSYPGAWPAGLPTLVSRLLARRPEDRPGAGTVVRELINLQIGVLARRRA